MRGQLEPNTHDSKSRFPPGYRASLKEFVIMKLITLLSLLMGYFAVINARDLRQQMVNLPPDISTEPFGCLMGDGTFWPSGSYRIMDCVLCQCKGTLFVCIDKICDPSEPICPNGDDYYTSTSTDVNFCTLPLDAPLDLTQGDCPADYFCHPLDLGYSICCPATYEICPNGGDPYVEDGVGTVFCTGALLTSEYYTTTIKHCPRGYECTPLDTSGLSVCCPIRGLKGCPCPQIPKDTFTVCLIDCENCMNHPPHEICCIDEKICPGHCVGFGNTVGYCKYDCEYFKPGDTIKVPPCTECQCTDGNWNPCITDPSCNCVTPLTDDAGNLVECTLNQKCPENGFTCINGVCCSNEWVPCENPLLNSTGFPYNCVYKGCPSGYSCVANSDNYGVCCPDKYPCCLEPESGPCDDYIPRWYHDCRDDTCKEFIYSGCDANDNNFLTRADCEKTCGEGFCELDCEYYSPGDVVNEDCEICISVLALFAAFLMCKCGEMRGNINNLFTKENSGLLKSAEYTTRNLSLPSTTTSQVIVGLGAFVSTRTQRDMLTNLTAKAFGQLDKNITGKSTSITIEVSVPEFDTSNYFEIARVICEELLPHNAQGLLVANDEDSFADNYMMSRYVVTAAVTVGLPVISLNPGLPLETLFETKTETPPTLLQLAASIHQQCAAILDFLAYHEWFHFNVITSNAPGHVDFLHELELQIKQLKSYYYQWQIAKSVVVDVSANVYLPMQELSYSNTSVHILYSTREEARTLFKYAKSFNYLDKGYVWIAAELAMGSMESLRRAPSEFPPGLIAVKFQSLAYNFEERTVDAVSLYKETFVKFSKSRSFSYDSKKRNCNNPNVSDTDFYDILKNISVPGRSSFAFTDSGFVQNPRIIFASLNENHIWKKVGMWKNGTVDVGEIEWMGNPELSPTGFTHRKHLRIVTIVEEPFVTIVPYEQVNVTCQAGIACSRLDGTTGEVITECCSGYCMDLLKMISRDLGFTYDIYIVEDNLYGVVFDNGSWNGIVKDLIEGKADAAVAAVKMSTERYKVIDFSVPFMDVGVAVLVPKSSGVVLPHAFLAPFDIAIWVIVLVVTLNVAAVSVFVFEFVSPTGYNRKIAGLKESNFTLGRAVWMTWGILFNNSVPAKVPRSYTGKFMTNMWASFALVFVAMYTGNLAAHMIHEERHEKITGINDTKIQHPDLIDPPFKFGTVQHTSVERLIMKTYPEMYKYMKDYVQPSAVDAAAALEAGIIDAFVYDSAVLENLEDKDPSCNLVMVGKVYGSTGFAVAFSRGSPWKAQFDKTLLLYDDLGMRLFVQYDD
uniref:Glutamate receptor ionotropic, NMDA 2B-like n=1 Tax=Saccoglossus kowalevskii TaxID=10224 RepID=A0ABM0M3T2_SACKO|nr:PREDICTED: glutamate receptor ionotropic, NMDA 2B-like [Saccoglossus kowalevskii]